MHHSGINNGQEPHCSNGNSHIHLNRPIDKSNSQNQAINHNRLREAEASTQACQFSWQDLRINASIDPQSQEDPERHGKFNFILV